MPDDNAALVRLYTLSRADLDMIRSRRGDRIASARRCNSPCSVTPALLSPAEIYRRFAAEFGIVARQGPWHVSALRDHLKYIDEETVPAAAEGAILLLFDQFDDLSERINELGSAL